MPRVERTSIAARAAEVIRADIASGKWTDRLPGSRVLALETGVSQPNITAALQQLAREGLLSRSGDRKAYRIRHQKAGETGSGKPQEKRRLVILTHVDIGELPYTTRKAIEMTRDKLVRLDWAVELRTFDFLHAKRPHRAWDHIVPVDPAIPLIAVFGRTPIGEWALRHGLRIAFLGGMRGDLPISVVAVKSSLLADEAMRRMTALGHRQILLPLCDRPAPFAAGLKDSVKNGLEQVGVTYVPSYHTPESPYQRPEVIWRMLESAFKRKPPTAIIVLDWKEFVTVSCFLSHLGLRIPDDVSVVLLNEQMEAEWFVPKLACFRFPVGKIALALAHWAEGKESARNPKPMSADFDEGESLAPPP